MEHDGPGGSVTSREVVPIERIQGAIRRLRGQNIILDADLARLYAVETKAVVRAVNRNRERFPADCMFQLTVEEFAALRYHSGTSNPRGGRRYRPFAFTEQGVAMRRWSGAMTRSSRSSSMPFAS